MRAVRVYPATPVFTMVVMLFILTVSSPLLAHVVLLDPQPRSNETNLTEDPCGGMPAGESTATYTAGTDIEIRVDVPQTHTTNVRAFISFDQFATRTELARITIESMGIYDMTVPLPAVQSGPAVLQVVHARYVSCADITVLEGAPFSINAGLNDAWVSADAPLQGLFFTIYESLELLFLSWFTFDSVAPDPGATTVFSAPDQRWVTGVGNYGPDTVVLNVELTSGGIFNADDPVATQSPGYGTITIVFISCSKAILTYSFPALDLRGQMTLTRALPAGVQLCEALSTL